MSIRVHPWLKAFFSHLLWLSRAVALAAFCVLGGCGRYAEFRLPDPGPPERGEWRWSARAAPALERGVEGSDTVDVLNPSVLEHGGRLLNFYSGFDGRAWRTLAAESADGVTWTKRGVILSPDANTWEGGSMAANGSAQVWGGAILYWYQAGTPPRLGLARSDDGGRSWKKEPAAVLELGPRGAWDERAAADPYVLEAGGRLYLYYLGEDRARRQRLGVAASDDGRRWTKLRNNPVLELGVDGAFDENGLGEPAVWKSHGWYWMLYTGRDRREVRRLGFARSRDGVHWERTGEVLAGGEAWNSKVLCDATVKPDADRVRVWYGGGDVAHPAENIHGRIGYGELRWIAQR